MSLLSFFTPSGGAKVDGQPAPAAPAAEPVKQTGPGQTPNNQPTGTGDATVPGSPSAQSPAAKKQSDSPLAEYAELWKNDGKVETPDIAEQLAMDPTKAQETISKADFTSAIPAELRARIQAGGEDASTAMLEAINTVSQQVMLKSLLAANELSTRGAKAVLSHQEKTLPGQFRNFTVNQQLSTENPMLSDPAVAPMVDMVKTGLQAKFPDATSAEIAAMTTDYFKTFATSFVPSAPASQPGRAPVNSGQDTNWEEYWNNG